MKRFQICGRGVKQAQWDREGFVRCSHTLDRGDLDGFLPRSPYAYIDLPFGSSLLCYEDVLYQISRKQRVANPIAITWTHKSSPPKNLTPEMRKPRELTKCRDHRGSIYTSRHLCHDLTSSSPNTPYQKSKEKKKENIAVEKIFPATLHRNRNKWALARTSRNRYYSCHMSPVQFLFGQAMMLLLEFGEVGKRFGDVKRKKRKVRDVRWDLIWSDLITPQREDACR